MTTQHTPGPWNVRKCDGFYRCFDTDDWAIVSDGLITPCFVWGGRSFTEGEANARLIAAAPELLATLKVMREAVYEQPVGVWFHAIDAAIAKAEL